MARRRHLMGRLVHAWALCSLLLVLSLVAFLFGFVLLEGLPHVSWEFLTTAPSGAVLGEEGGILPAIVGSLWFTGVAVVLGGTFAVAVALFVTYLCPVRLARVTRAVLGVASGIPSIVFGLYAYSLFVRDLDWGRCILSSGVALAIMILPFVEVRVEKALRELPAPLVSSSLALGCSLPYTIRRVVLPAVRGQVVGALVLGACYAMGATAPLMFTGAVAFARLPRSVMDPAMALPMHLYLLVAQGTTSLGLAYGTALVMMAIILVGNVAVTAYTRRSVRRWKSS